MKEKKITVSYRKFEILLNEKGMTAYKVSQETKIPPSTLSDWKKGVSYPKTDKLHLLAQYFGVTIEYFLEEV